MVYCNILGFQYYKTVFSIVLLWQCVILGSSSFVLAELCDITIRTSAVCRNGPVILTVLYIPTIPSSSHCGCFQVLGSCFQVFACAFKHSQESFSSVKDPPKCWRGSFKCWGSSQVFGWAMECLRALSSVWGSFQVYGGVVKFQVFEDPDNNKALFKSHRCHG